MLKLFLFTFFPVILWAQDIDLIGKKPLDADRFIGFDQYNSIYYIRDQVLFKTDGETVYNFNDIQLGRIHSVDLVNPLNIVVFYADLNTVVFLDNKLNEIERVGFSSIPGLTNIESASLAGKNQLWIFNPDSQQLELYNFRSKRKAVVSQPIKGNIRSVSSDFNSCYVLTHDKLRCYNLYGSLIFEQSLLNYETIVHFDNELVALKDNTLYFLDLDTFIPKKIISPEFTIKDLQLTQDFLYLYDGIKIYTFSLKLLKK